MDGTHDIRFLRVDEVAQEARVSLSTVRHWLRVGRLGSVKLGKHRVVPREAFEQMITSGWSPCR
jgi:excisionase family DNA binding protein